jgi:hypothetical protein
MPYTYEQLHAMTVAQLRDIAKDLQHEAVSGFSTMHKEKLVPAICHALGIDTKVHHHVVGLDKDSVKAELRALKTKKGEALAAGNRKEFKVILRQIHDLKLKLRRATV